MSFPRKNLFFLFAHLLLVAGCTTQIPNSKHLVPEGRSATRLGGISAISGGGGYEYAVQSGDRLRLEFVGHDELDRDILVRPDGRISVPMIEDMVVSGATLRKLRKLMLSKYRDVLHDPVFSLSLTSSQPQFIYVGGEIRNGGMVVPYSSRLTAQEAIIAAGGVSPRGELKRAFILRDVGTTEPEYLLSVLWNSDEGVYNDYYLQPKDVLIVPSSRVAEASQFVNQYLNELIPFSKTLGVQYSFGTTGD